MKMFLWRIWWSRVVWRKLESENGFVCLGRRDIWI